MKKGDFESVVMEDMPCPKGCKRDDELLFTSHDFLSGLPGTFSVVRCKQCNLIRTNPRPTPDTIGFYYPENYGPYLGTMVTEDDTSKPHWRRWIKDLFSSHSMDIPKIAPGNMLELGCASGSFLHTMAKQGWNVEGIEFSPSAAERARELGYPVYIGALETAPTPEKKFDLIAAWMVLEHLHEPVQSLTKLNSWANDNAYLAFSVPNSDSFFFDEYSYNLQVPTHLYHYIPQTISEMLEFTGWKVEKIIHQVTLSSLLASIGYRLRESQGDGKLSNWLIDYPVKGGKFHYAFYPAAYILSKFGQTGRMTIWARKND